MLSAVPYKGTQGGFVRLVMISLHSLPCQVHGRREGTSQQWRVGQTRIPGDRRRCLQICARQTGTEFDGGDDRNITAERFLSTQQELQQRPGSDYGEVMLSLFGASTKFLICRDWWRGCSSDWHAQRKLQVLYCYGVGVDCISMRSFCVCRRVLPAALSCNWDVLRGLIYTVASLHRVGEIARFFWVLIPQILGF